MYTSISPSDLHGPAFLVEGEPGDLSWRLVEYEGGEGRPTDDVNPSVLRGWGDAVRSIERTAMALGLQELHIVDARREPWLARRVSF